MLQLTDVSVVYDGAILVLKGVSLGVETGCITTSLGLAPLIVEEIFRIVVRLKQELGKTVLSVEQIAAVALEIADHAYVMETGRIMLSGPTATVRADSAVQEFSLGLNDGGARRSYRQARPSRRRARRPA